MAIAQPILDLYGKNVTIFSAAKLSRLDVGLFLLVVLLLPALIATGIDRFSALFGPRVNEATRLLIIGGFSFLLGLAIARWLVINTSLGSVATGGIVAVLVSYGFDRFKLVREWSRLLAVTAVVVGGLAMVQLSPVLSSGNGPKSDAVVGQKDVTVFQIIFDEFPLFSLLGPDGTIQADRFPGFAALAAESTWFRNSVTESNFTHQAVPAILASTIPKKTAGPFLLEYPKNIFTLFGNSSQGMTVDGIEPVTSLCPKNLCKGSNASAELFSVDRFMSFLRDATYVYGHRVMPPLVRRHLPSVEGTWGGFSAVRIRFGKQFASGALVQPDAIGKGTARLIAEPSPRVEVVHALLPHQPWRLTPDERVNQLSKSISTKNPDNEEGVRDTYQAYLYQLGAADKVIGEVVSKLKAAGRWNNTMLVVTADHGISFIPAVPQRNTDFSDPDSVNDIYRVPTFIKFPNQTTPVVSDCPISNLDLLPTIIAVTETKTSWRFAGKSLATACPTGRIRQVVSATGQRSVLDDGFESVRKRVDYYATLVSNVGPLRGVAGVGDAAELIGQPIGNSQPSTGVWWTLKQAKLFENISEQRGAVIPGLITGVITADKSIEDGAEGIVVIDGIAAGVIGEASGARGATEYTAILDYTLLTKGSHTVELYIRSRDGVLTRVGAPR